MEMDYPIWKTIRGPLGPFVKVQEVSTSDELLTRIQDFPYTDQRWAFRGQKCASWGLKTSLELVATRRGDTEDWVMEEFKRRAHQYVRNVHHDEYQLE